MWRRLEREIRLLPHVLACSFSQDDVVVLIEPSADPDQTAARVRELLEDAGEIRAIRVLGGSARPVPVDAAGIGRPARGRAGAIAALLALGVLGASALFSAVTIDGPQPGSSPPPLAGGFEPGLERPLRPIVDTGAPAPRPASGVDSSPVGGVPPLGDPGGGGTGDGTVPAPPAGVEPPDVETTPRTDPGGVVSHASCVVRAPGRSHVLLVKADADRGSARVLLVDPPGFERAHRRGTLAFSSRGRHALPAWVVSILQDAGCDLSWRSRLGRAVRSGLHVAVLEPDQVGPAATEPAGDERGSKRHRDGWIGDDPRERRRGARNRRAGPGR